MRRYTHIPTNFFRPPFQLCVDLGEILRVPAQIEVVPERGSATWRKSQMTQHLRVEVLDIVSVYATNLEWRGIGEDRIA